MRGKTFIISGPSGVGKSTVLSALLEKRKNLYFSVSATTRDPRPGELDGIHYHFMDAESFRKWIAMDQFLEYAEYVGNFYGTPKRFVDEAMDKGQDVILDIEVQGALQVTSKRPDTVKIFIAPPSWKELERRLKDRGTDDPEKVQKRLLGPRWSSRPPIPTIILSSTIRWRMPSGSWTPSSPPSTASPRSVCLFWRSDRRLFPDTIKN